MKKRIIIIAFLLFLSSFIVILIFGRKNVIEYNIENIKSVSIYYDKKIIKCEKEIKKDKLKIKITGLHKGKTNINIKIYEKTNNSKIEMREIKKTVYVHYANIITIDKYLGNCNGDIGLIISFLLTLLITLLYAIRQFKRGVKKNLYEYRNIRLLGLIIFIGTIFLWNLYTFIIDIINNYHMSLYIFIQNMKDSSMLFTSFMLPLAFLTTILLNISNTKLVIKEGKTWKNMLGIILGNILCFTTLIFITIGSTQSHSNNIINTLINSIPFFISAGITYFECILLATIIIGFISAKRIPKFDKDYIIILGCKIKEDGKLLPLLKSRVDKALEFAKLQKEKNNKDIIFVPSGGKGQDEIISEAEAMKNYLIEKGINENQIIIETNSKSTYENIKYSNNLIKEKSEKPNIAFCTSNYHVFRAGNIASTQGLYIEGIGAKTKTYYWINAFIREFAATLVSEKNKNIKVLIILILITLIINILSYISMYL